jgi:hypothetical protein
MGARTPGVVLAVFAIGLTAWWIWPDVCRRFNLCYPACRIAANGVESWTRLEPIIRQSEWIAAGASPGNECLTLLTTLRKQHPQKQVAIDTVSMAHERVPKLFYQYDCTFDVQEPVYQLARNAHCPPEPDGLSN